MFVPQSEHVMPRLWILIGHRLERGTEAGGDWRGEKARSGDSNRFSVRCDESSRVEARRRLLLLVISYVGRFGLVVSVSP